MSNELGNILNPKNPFNNYDNQQRMIRQIQMERMEIVAQNSVKAKLIKIADLFEMDVLSEDDALKACKTVIQQHAKVKGKVGSDKE